MSYFYAFNSQEEGWCSETYSKLIVQAVGLGKYKPWKVKKEKTTWKQSQPLKIYLVEYVSTILDKIFERK